MFDEKLYQKICNVTCSEEELIAISEKVRKHEFDLKLTFDQHYSLQSIETAINKYLDGTINEHYLAYWMNAYNWLICFGGDSNTNTLKKYIECQFCGELTALTFIDEYNFEKVKPDAPAYFKSPQAYLHYYLERLRFYDLIYQNLNNFEVYYHVTLGEDCRVKFFRKDTIKFLCVNPQNKTYLFYNFIDSTEGAKIDATQLTDAELDAKVQLLKQLGYHLIAPNFEF